MSTDRPLDAVMTDVQARARRAPAAAGDSRRARRPVREPAGRVFGAPARARARGRERHGRHGHPVRSFVEPLVVLLAAPLSFVGAIALLLVTGTALNVSSLHGSDPARGAHREERDHPARLHQLPDAVRMASTWRLASARQRGRGSGRSS